MHKIDSNYYNSILEEYWYKDMRDEIKPIDFSLWNMSAEDLSLWWFCHHNCNSFAELSDLTSEKVKVITWIWISGVPHLWTLSQILKATKLQSEGKLAVKFVLWDLDAYNGKGTPLKYARDLWEHVRKFMLSIWFDDSWRNELCSQFDELEILRTMYLSSLFMDDELFDDAEEDLHSFYVKSWKVDEQMSFRRKQSLALMVAWWYHQFLYNWDEKILVTLGIDEHKYVKFGQRVLAKMQQSDEFSWELKGKEISAMYTTLIRGFDWYPKMSKSFPNSWITLDMSKDKITDLILNREGKMTIPEDNVVLQCICNTSRFTQQEINDAFSAYNRGGREWEQVKKKYIEDLWSLLEEWQKYYE